MSSQINAVFERIRQRRTELSMSYGELSKKTGINKGTLQRYEAGLIGDIPTQKLKAIAAALDVTPSYLLGEECAAGENLREKYGLWGDIDEMVEAMHKNPKLRLLFSRSAKMDEEGVDAVLRIVELMRRENGDA